MSRRRALGASLPGLLVTLAAAVSIAGCGSARTATVTSAAAPAASPATASSTTVSTSASTTSAAPSTTAAASWPEFGYDPQRSGAGPVDSGITAAGVSRLRMRTVTLPGIADSSAIELGGLRVGGRTRDVAFVTTSYGTTLAVDARTGARLWTYRPSGVNSTPGNPQVTTAAPIADPDHHAIYAAAPDGTIVKLSATSGHLLWRRSVTLDPVHEKIASALNLDGANVVAVTGGYDGDIPPYDGHVVTLRRTTGQIVHVWNTECSNRHRLIRASSCAVTNTRGDDAIWGRAGAVIEPGSGRILTATGNGPFNGHTNWGDSVLELSPDASRLLHNWTPANQAALDAGDVDVGSTSPALLGVVHGHDLAVQGGKDGKLHLLDLDRLNGTTGGAGPRLGGQLGETSTPGGGELLTAPAVWRDHGHVYLFVGNDSGSAAYELTGARHPRLRVVWQNSTPATSPVVAGGLVYLYDAVDGRLVVRHPLSGDTIRSFVVPAGHWNSPIVVGGRVILPTGSYHDSDATSSLIILHLPGD